MARGFYRVESGDPQGHGVARRHPQLLRFARLRDIPVERGQAAFLLGQEATLQQLADDALDRFRQAPLAFAAGLAGSEVRHQVGALPGASDQDIHLPPGQAQRLSSGVGGLMADHPKRCQRSNDLGPAPGVFPCLGG